MEGFKRVDTTANRLRIAMEHAGKRQADLVRETGINKGALSHYLKGKYEPKQDWIYKFAKALDVSEMWLWGYECEMTRPIEQQKNDALADIIIRMRTDDDFMSVVKILSQLDANQLASVKQMLNAFCK